MHVKKAHKVILSIFLTTLFLSLQFVVGGRLTYATGLKNYNSNGVDFLTGTYYRDAQGSKFNTILVIADQTGSNDTLIDNPTANGSYPTASYSFVGAGFSSISSNFSYTSSKEVVVSGLSLGHMYTTYSNSGIEQVVKLDGPDANQSTNFSQISVNTGVHYYLEFGSIDTSIRPQFTATPSQYNGINYNLYSVDSQYISSEEGTYNLTGFNLGSEIRWPDDQKTGLDLTLVQDVNVPQNGVYIYDRIETIADLKYGNVTVKYVDGAGNTISDNVVKSGNIGDDYSTDQKAIPGYTFKEIQGSASGQFTDQEQTVTYVYTKDNDKPVITAPNQDYKVGDSIDPLKNVTASDKENGTTKVTVAKIVDQDGKVIDSIPNDKAGKYTVTYTTTDADGNTVTKDATISVRSNEKPGNGTDNGNPSSNQPGNPSQPSNATNNGVIDTSTNIGSKVNNGAVNSPELPQTGENNRQSQTMSFIGVLLAMFGSLLGFLGIKKRRND